MHVFFRLILRFVNGAGGTIVRVRLAAGPALGGALFAVSRLLPFAADALSYVVSLVTLRITPNRMLARVSSVSLQIGWGAIPLGSLLAGVLLESLSPGAVIGIVAAAVAVTAVAATAAPAMRHAGSTRDPWLDGTAPAL